MPTPETLALAEAHQQAQARLSAGTLIAMLGLWRALDPTDLDRTTPLWLRLVLPVIRTQRSRSASMTATFLAAMRSLEVGADSTYRPRPAAEINEEQVITSLMVMGPQALRSAAERQRIEEFEAQLTDWVDIADRLREAPDAPLPARPVRPPLRPVAAPQAAAIRDSVARAAQRHVLNGSRDTVDDAVKNDRRVVGFVRVTGADPCFWCAMLASRGPVYKEDSFEQSDMRFQGPGNHKVHDGCGCGLRPVYRRSEDEWPERSRTFQELWNEHGAKFSGPRAVYEFRRAYEHREDGTRRAYA